MKFSTAVKNIVIGAEGPDFDSRVGQIGHSAPMAGQTLRRFFGAVLPRH